MRISRISCSKQSLLVEKKNFHLDSFIKQFLNSKKYRKIDNLESKRWSQTEISDIQSCIESTRNFAQKIDSSIRRGKSPPLYDCKLLIRQFLKLNYPQIALEIFQHLLQYTQFSPIFTHYLIIDILCGDEDSLELLLKKAETSEIPLTRSQYTHLMVTLSQLRKWDKIERVIKQMINSQITPDLIAYNLLIKAFLVLPWPTCKFKAFEILEEMKLQGFSPNLFTYVALLKICKKGNDISTALTLCKEMEKSLRTTQGFRKILVYLFWNDPKNALSIAQEFQNEPSYQPNISDFNFLIYISAHPQFSFTTILDIFDEMRKLGITPNLRTYEYTLLACLLKRESDTAILILTNMLKQGLWSQIAFCRTIEVCAQTHNSEKAVAILSDMEKHNLEPHPSTLLILLHSLCVDQKLHLIVKVLRKVRNSLGPQMRIPRVIVKDLVSIYKRPGLPREIIAEIFQFLRDHRDELNTENIATENHSSNYLKELQDYRAPW